MSDPYISDVVVLYNFDGADGDTSYAPEVGPTPSFMGTAQIDTDISYFSGLGSLLLVSSGSNYVNVGSVGDFNFLHDGTEDYTVEAIVRATSFSGGSRGIFDTYSNSTTKGFALYAIDTGRPAVRIHNTLIAQTGSVMSTNVWYYLAVTYVQSTNTLTLSRYRASDDQLSTVTGTPSAPSGIDGDQPRIGWYYRTSTRFIGNIDCIRITRGVARTITGTPTAPWDGGQAFTCLMQAPFMLQDEKYIGFNNFSSVVAAANRPGITLTQSTYYMEISGSPTLTIPISSWQATNHLDRTQYLQCVVPAVDDYVSDIAARQGASNFAIYRRTTLPSGFVHNVKVAESLLESVAFSEGGRNYSCTLSGYPDGASAPTIPASYELAGVRYITENSTGTIVARCAIDWLLRPGDIVTTGDISFTADYINYFANDRDSYMDVGSR